MVSMNPGTEEGSGAAPAGGSAGDRPAGGDAVDPDFFDDDYYRVLAPFHPAAETRFETAALRELLGLAQDERVLDLGCGWGRHLALLADAGHAVVGVDRSLPLLRRARGGADPPGREPGSRAAARLVAGDMTALPFAAASFDAVVNLATSIGLFLEDAPAVEAMAEARRVLAPAGRLLVEGMHRADVERDFAARDGWTLEDGTRVRVRRRFDADRGVSHEVLRWDGPAGGGEKRHSLRVRTGDEMVGLLEAAGLTVAALYGDWTGEPFDPGSPRLIVLAEGR